MSFSDPIGDMLARIRNAQMRYKSELKCPFSKMRASVLDVLVREGFVEGYEVAEIKKGISELTIKIKYHNGQPVIENMKRVSKPGRRVYSSIKDLTKVSNGLGISILSTPKGLLSDEEARQQNVGGEVICQVM